MKSKHIIWFYIILILAPSTAFAHYLSVSFSNWEFQKDKAKAVFRIPLTDAIWAMDSDLVVVQEATIKIRIPVDGALRGRVSSYLLNTIPQKVTLSKCVFDPDSITVTFDKIAAQVHAELSCSPDYLDNLELTNHFLVDKNRLHTSLATFNLPGNVRQFIFRSGQFTYSAKGLEANVEKAPAWQARIAPWWDYFAIGTVLLLLADSAGSLAILLMILIMGNLFAPLAFRIGLPIPSLANLLCVLSALPIYGGLFLTNRAPFRKSTESLGLFYAIHLVFLLLAWAEFIRLSPLMVVGLTLMGTSVLYSHFSANLDAPIQIQIRQAPLYFLVLSFGLVHGFILLRYMSQYGQFSMFHAGKLPMFTLLSAAALAYPTKRLLNRFRAQSKVAFVIAITGSLIFIVRNVNLPFSTFNYDNARDLLQSLIQTETLQPALLPLILTMSVVIGGLHALTPGHGKAIVAAYLVGTRGRVLDAIILGLIVTITHTSIIIALAILALTASKYILPEQLMPWINITSGFMILGLGLVIFQLRLRNYLRYGTSVPLPKLNYSKDSPDTSFMDDEYHDHPNAGSQSDNHQPPPSHQPGQRQIAHSHNGVTHTHIPQDTPTSLWSLTVLGITGGIVPCPDALAILLMAVSLNRILLGLSVIITFSAGLAAVLIIIGIAMIKFRPLMERFTGQGRLTVIWLPLFSAGLITVLGALMLWRIWSGP